MAEKPIIFSAEMVRAILDGRKTQTRRIVKAKPPKYFNVTNIGWLENTKLLKKRRELVKVYSPGWYWIDNDAPCGAISGPFKCPYGKPGDLLYVRETWRRSFSKLGQLPDGIEYKANNLLVYFDKSEKGKQAKEWVEEKNILRDGKWRSGRFMPKILCDLWLKVTDIRVELVQDISADDTLKEGCDVLPEAYNDPDNLYYQLRSDFMNLWDRINKKRGYGWDENPFVWVIEFESCTTSTT